MENRIVEFALDFEKKGVMLYLDLAAGTKNALSKKLFYALAKQEFEHAIRIDEFYLGTGVPAYSEVYKSVNDVEDEIKVFFAGIKDAALSAESNLNAYETAMKLEKESYSAYEKFLRESKDNKEKQLLGFLLSEEKNHLEAILNVYSYLTGTSDWLEQEESRTWNWMNI